MDEPRSIETATAQQHADGLGAIKRIIRLNLLPRIRMLTDDTEYNAVCARFDALLDARPSGPDLTGLRILVSYYLDEVELIELDDYLDGIQG